MPDRAEMIESGMEPIEGHPGLYMRRKRETDISPRIAQAVARAIVEFEMTGKVETTFKNVLKENETNSE